MSSRLLSLLLAGAIAGLLALSLAGPAGAAKVPDIARTKHNLSTTSTGTVKATSESQICVFCHTPHAAENVPNAPLWNRKLSAATYTPYTSSSIEASAAELSAGPGGSSKLCLSCHDGTMALGSVNVLGGKANQTIALAGTNAGTMATGSGATTGFTRALGVNLTNDHPISFTYDATLATNDGELRTPDGTKVGTRSAGVKPKLPLESGKMQCTTCHDPHIRETDAAKGAAKFLRVNRFQEGTPAGGAYSETNDIICLACHDKGGQTWALSAHAHPDVADELLNSDATTQREFPASLPVWKASCLSCHDTHSVQGSRRLLREGTNSTASPKAGGVSAIEETCYQCHAASGTSILTNVAKVPNIKSDFALARRMPITSADQALTTQEVHDIGTGSGTQRGKDFVESPARMGKGVPDNRHVECTDCHNPHRVIKNRLFNANPATPDAAGTHNHAAGHTNLASGVLKGITGVEPVYGSAEFGTNPDSFDIKRGDGGATASSDVGSAWVTREYQVCLKCHSNNAYDTPPTLGSTGGNTPSGTNQLTRYTNQAMEFQAPSTHRGQTSTTDSGAYKGQVRNPAGCATCGSGGCTCYNVDFQNNNHRGWHPVMASTGRDLATRKITNTTYRTDAWRSPWNAVADVGSQTMYCTDCHGSNTADNTVVPDSGEDGNAWGPHGSANNFLLKGEWSSTTGTGSREGGYTTNALCFKCHNPANYAHRNGLGSVSNLTTGFSNSSKGNLHAYHTDKIERLRCTWCHVAVPHGWKNKAFLVNLNDVGPEAGLAAGTQVRNNTKDGYNKEPYYVNAVLKVRTFATSGNWSEGNCGSVGTPGNGQSGKSWMRDSNEACGGMP